MPEETARDRASQLRRPRQARVSMRRAGEPMRWRCPCLGTSDGFQIRRPARMDGPARPRSGLGAVWTKQMLFSLTVYTFSTGPGRAGQRLSMIGARAPLKLAMGIVNPVTVFAYQSLGTKEEKRA